jgi:hypothetical protein
MCFKSNTFSGRSQIYIYLIFIMIGIGIRNLYPPTNVSPPCVNMCDNTYTQFMNQSKGKNLILSSGTSIPLLKIYRFIRSARSACNDCSIIIFIDDIHNQDFKQLAILYNVLFLSYHDHSPREMKFLRTVILRFLIYYRYLLKHQYDNVFICDLTDVLFQKNLFQNMQNNIQLYAFLESKELTIGGCHLHREWILPCYGQKVLTYLYDKSRSCAGSTLGTYKGNEF